MGSPVHKAGRDYGPRINDVLKAFMRAQLMGLLHGDETVDQFRKQEQSWPGSTPRWKLRRSANTPRKLIRHTVSVRSMCTKDVAGWPF
jgi:hypothetical protein